jgi:tRNA A-37 threonylcarbamoyl transferase component Bud32
VDPLAAVESTFLLQAILGVAVATLGIAVAVVLLALGKRDPCRWTVAIALGLAAGAEVNRIRLADPAHLADLDPANPWFRWLYDIMAFQHVAWIAVFAFFPERVRWRTPRGVLLLVVGAIALVGSAAWLFARPLVWVGWPRAANAGTASAFDLLFRVTFQSGLAVGMLALFVAAIVETRAKSDAHRRGGTMLLVGVFAPFFITAGRAIPDAIDSALRSGDPLASAGYLRFVAGDCCGASLWLYVVATLSSLAVATWLWRETRSLVALAVCVFGILLWSLVAIAPGPWGFSEVNVIVSALVVMVAAQRRRAFGEFHPPAAVAFTLALLAAACVFLSVNAYTLGFPGEIVLAVGIFAGTLLAAAAAFAMLPAGQVHVPWTAVPVGGERALAAYRSALAAEIGSGTDAAAAVEKLRPLRGELGLSDRDHAVLEHAMRASATGASATPLRRGDSVLGRYRVERVLVQGASGRVYLAHDDRLGRQVALKQLGPEQGRDRAALERLKRETRLASALQHPGVVVVHDIEVVGNEAFIVMEHVSGGSLEERLRVAPLAESDVRRIGRDVLGALDGLHARGIVHRDVKPSNILLAEDGHAKLSDFSVARTVVSGDTVGLTRDAAASRGVVGTPAFMSPEQARGLSATAQSDLYGLGASLYAALSGRPPIPVDGLSEFEARLRVTDREPALPLAGVSSAMNGVMSRALAKDPSDRFPSARAMAAALALPEDEQ